MMEREMATNMHNVFTPDTVVTSTIGHHDSPLYIMPENGFPRPKKRWHSRPSPTTDNHESNPRTSAIKGITNISRMTHGHRDKNQLSSHGDMGMQQHDAMMPAAFLSEATLTKTPIDAYREQTKIRPDAVPKGGDISSCNNTSEPAQSWSRDFDHMSPLGGQPPPHVSGITQRYLSPICLQDIDCRDNSQPSDELPDPKCRLHKNSPASSLTTMSKLAWMAPIPPADSILDRESPYHPSRSTVSVSALRFDFRGRLIPPRLARMIPPSQGLHHHAEAPEAAGYTVRELAFLCRSAVPAQRCIAYQTLGRLLYRLGNGEWGDHDDTLATGIWDEIKCGRVIDSLHEASRNESGHAGCHAFATEALTLHQKGGWSSTHNL